MLSDKASLHRLIKNAEKRLEKAGVATPAAEVELILEHLLDVARLDIYLHGEKLIDDDVCRRFEAVIKKRLTRYPLQYILGEAYFYGRKFTVTPDVMVPTPETELLCELALDLIRHKNIETPRILDVGTGSGVVAVTIAAEMPDAEVTALDISGGALDVARGNAASYQLERRIIFIRSDLYGGLRPQRRFDLVLSNPPYITENDYKTLMPEVLADPKLALTAGTDGLDIIRRLIERSPDYLLPGGRLLFEIGYDQSEKVSDITADDARYKSMTLFKDLNDIDRVVMLGV